MPVTQCPSPCPQSCAPSCQSSCCQQFSSAPVPPQQPQVSMPVTQCPSPCPQSCAPSCQSSCCQQSVPAPVPQCPSPCPKACAPSCLSSCCQRRLSGQVSPQPVYQPSPVLMPPPPPQPLQVTVSTPQVVLEQPTQQWNPRAPGQVYSPQPFPSQVSQPIGLSGSQCSAGCSPNCAPSCSPTCCKFFDSGKRKGDVKNYLIKQTLNEEKH